MRKTIAAVALLSMCLSTLPAAALAETGVTGSEIMFGTCVPLSGGNKINGVAYSNGAKAYFDYLNAEKGGVHGRKINLVLGDDGYDPEKAVTCYKSMLDKGVFATGLAIGTPTGAKYVLLADNNKVPFIGNAGGPGLMYQPLRKYVFAVRASYADEIKLGIEHLWKDVGARKFAVIYQNDALGASVIDGVKAGLKGFDADIVAQGSYPRNTTDVDAAMKTVKAASPDVVYIGGVTVPMGEILKKAKADGWNPIFVPLPARDAELIKVAGDATEGIVVGNATPPEMQTSLPTIALYHKAMKKYVPDADRGGLSLLGFVDALVIGEALTRAGKDLTRDGLVATIESMNGVDIGLGSDFKLHYSAQDHKGFDNIAFTTIRNGKAVPITDWKKEITHK